MKRVIFAAAALLFACDVPAVASDKADVMAVINKLNDSMNQGDLTGPASLYAPNATIIDEFSPHLWAGAHAHADWIADWSALAKANAITNVKLTLSKPLHLDVTGDRAYVVVPTLITDKTKGKPHRERGLWTFAMQKGGSGWMIASWAWATE